ncbi:MAG: hypothetical protein B6I31_05470 [Desulfobacteraceae bacterium 4572_19]|nr:MAG: hypothetical protein B6I31_05470 [Desulfobacteraceae bacterium 4572_19]
MQLEAPSDFAKRTGHDAEKMKEQLEIMAQKGTLFRKRSGEKLFYAAVPYVIGSYEFQLKTMDKEFADLMEQYNDEKFTSSISNCIAPLRTIPVHKSLTVKHNVASYFNAREIVKSKKLISLADCVCRVQQKLIGKGCDKPMEACFAFGSHAKYYIENNMGREISQEEALAILDECEKAGLVNQPASMINPGGMCNCCSDCCGVLKAVSKLPKPAEHVMNDYRVKVDVENCIGCGICIDRCQMDAVTVDDEQSLAVINKDRCIGCGLCVTTCPEEAMIIEFKGKENTIPANGMEYMVNNANKRGVSLIPLSMK